VARLNQIVFSESRYPYTPLTTRVSTGELPVMLWDIDVIPREQLIDYLRTSWCDIDTTRTRTQIADIRAFEVLINEKLSPAITYLQWLDKDNYNQILKNTWAAKVPFPINKYIAHREWRRQQNILRERRITSVSDAIEHIRVVLDAFAVRLSTRPYFFGDDCVSSIDLQLAAHVALLYHMPAATQSGRELLIRDYPALLPHAHALLQQYLPCAAAFLPASTVTTNNVFEIKSSPLV
jgi:hypothetical protein